MNSAIRWKKKKTQPCCKGCSGMPLKRLWGGKLALVIFDRLNKTRVQSGLLKSYRADFKLSSLRATCGGSPLGGREGEEQCRHSGFPPFQPSHICLHGPRPPLKRVVLPPPFCLAGSWMASGSESFSAGSPRFQIYFMRPELKGRLTITVARFYSLVGILL